MAAEANSPPEGLPPAAPRDLHPTSDIRLVMIQVAKLEERVNGLIEDNKGHKADFRWTWTGLVAGFLLLAGMFIYGYNRLDDRIIDISKAVATMSAKLDDLIQRTPPPPAGRR